MALNYYKKELKENAQLLASKGKGILAVDESTKTVGKRLAGIGVERILKTIGRHIEECFLLQKVLANI